MAMLTEVVYKDDLTGERIEGEVHYEPIVLDGVFYELTLCDDSYERFRAAIMPFLERADSHRMPKDLRRRLTDTNASHRRDVQNGAPKVPAQRDKDQAKKMREWWHVNADKLDLPTPSDRGRIPESVADAFHQHEGLNVGNGNNPEAVREAVNGVKKAADKPVREGKPDEPLPSKPGQVVTSESKAKKNGKAPKVGDEEFLAVYRQTGGEINAMVDALKGLTKAGIYSRVQRMRKAGQIPAKS